MRILVRAGTVCLAISATVAAVVAQEPDLRTSSASVERVRAALQSAPSITDHSLFVTPLDTLRFGPLTFVPTETPGQFVAVRVPIGAFASRTAHAFTLAQRRRAQDTARREVAQVVADLQHARPK